MWEYNEHKIYILLTKKIHTSTSKSPKKIYFRKKNYETFQRNQKSISIINSTKTRSVLFYYKNFKIFLKKLLNGFLINLFFFEPITISHIRDLAEKAERKREWAKEITRDSLGETEHKEWERAEDWSEEWCVLTEIV